MGAVGRRLLWIVGVAFAVALLLIAAQQTAETVAVTVLGLIGALLVWWWWRSPQGAITALSLAATLVLTSEITDRAGADLSAGVRFNMGLAYWCFAVTAILVIWLVPRHRGSRAITAVAAHAALVATSVGAFAAPSVVPIVGFVIAMAIVSFRSRRRRWKPRPDEFGPAELGRRADRTAERLAELCERRGDLTRYGPQRLSGRRWVEQLVDGPDTTYVVRTAAWGGSVGLLDNGSAYGLDGDSAELGARLAPIVESVREVSRQQGGSVEGVVVFWDDTRLSAEPLRMDLCASRRGRQRARITLVRGEHLTEWPVGSTAAEHRAPGKLG